MWDTAVSTEGDVRVMADDGAPFLIVISGDALIAAGETKADDLLEKEKGLMARWEIGIRRRYEAESRSGMLHSSPAGIPYVMSVMARDLVQS